MKKLFLCFSVVAVAVACAPKLTTETTVPEVVEEAVEEVTPVNTDVISADAVAGKKLYFSECAKCHKPKLIDNFTDAQWSGILPDMIAKAKIDEKQALQVTSYVNWELEH